MKDYTFTQENLDIEKISAIVKEYGLAIIPNYLTIEQNEKLLNEFKDILSTGDDASKTETPYSDGQCVRVLRKKLDSSRYPVTSEVFGSDFMKAMKSEYLSEESSLNEEIFVVKDVVGSKHVANDMHFDVIPTFKFFIYLSDTTKKNGAFTCVPKSHVITQKIREEKGKKISDKNLELTRDLPYQEDEIVPIEGKAGTMIIFTTETFHKAGQVSEGERLVMRGHSRLPEHQQHKSMLSKILNKFRA